MLPSQILLNNLINDASQTSIPSDDIDPETETEPARWDIGGIERYMLAFGPISSIFDYATFGLLLLVLHASEPEFHRAGSSSRSRRRSWSSSSSAPDGAPSGAVTRAAHSSQPHWVR
jgi:hypothetical protein